MLNKKTTRRELIRATAAVAGAASAAPALSLGMEVGADENLPLAEAWKLDQKRYIAHKLRRITHRSGTVTQADIDDFAVQFTEANGLLDYRKCFSRIDGDYQLARLFIQSTRRLRR